MSQLSFTPQVCEDGPFRGYAKLHWIRAAAERRRDEKVGSLFHHLGHRSMQAFTDWVKDARKSKPLRQLWDDAAARLRGHFSYFGVRSNEGKLNHFHFVCIGALFKWLNRRSQKRSFTWAQFERKLHFNPLPLPPHGDELIDLTSEHRSVRKHQPKSRMREIRKSGSVRSLNRSIGRLRFT